MNKLSIIVPAFVSAETAAALIIRVDAMFTNDKSKYEILFIDNNNPATYSEISKRQNTFPVRLISEDQWLQSAAFDTVAILTDIVNYPPEALPEMVDKLHERKKNILVGVKNHGRFRDVIWRLLKTSVTSLPCRHTPEQLKRAGLIILKKPAHEYKVEVSRIAIDDPDLIIKLAGTTSIAHRVIPRAFTLHATSRRARLRQRYGDAVLSVKKRLGLRRRTTLPIRQPSHGKVYFKGVEYTTHNTLPRQKSAIERTTLTQKIIMVASLLLLLALALWSGHFLVVAIVTVVTILYFCDLLFNLFLIYRSFKSYSEIVIKDEVTAQERLWPMYTVLCPLYKETLVIPQFIAAMEAIDYPKDRLEVMLLLEEDDVESIEAIKQRQLPHYFRMVVVPHSMPKTKPKACNYGLLKANGDYAVIYDAEDIPDPLQLKKAVLAFEQSGDSIGCIQAKLNYYNWNQNLLTRLFTLEYSLWFNLILTGLQSIQAPIPLGGTSNHFKTKMLRELGGWDPFNVTEDADLGIRLAKRGLKTAILDSTTLEEANSEFRNWLRQRSRWIKGYMQTYLVHTRNLREFGKNSSRLDMMTFQLVIGGKVLSMLINPLLWIMTLTYFLLRDQVGPMVEAAYLTPVFYIGAVSLVLGNFMYLYYYMMGAARQGRPELIVFAIFVPLYWIMMSIAAYYALRDLIIRPFHWHKTKHGLHLKKESKAMA